MKIEITEDIFEDTILISLSIIDKSDGHTTKIFFDPETLEENDKANQDYLDKLPRRRI